MKFTCKIKPFLEKLTAASRCSAKRDTKPELCRVLIAAKDGKIFFSATNHEQYVKTQLDDDAEIAKEGEFLAPAPKVVGFLSACGVETATFELSDSNLKISCGRSRCLLPTIPSETFPPFFKPDVEPETCFMVKKSAFEAAAKKAVPFMDGGTRYMATKGVKVDVSEKDKVFLVGFDGRTFGTQEIVAGHEKSDVVLSVPKEMFDLVASSFRDGDELTFYCFKNSIVAGSAETFVSSALIEGRFPAWRTVVDRFKKSGNFKIKKDTLLLKLRGLSSVLDGDTNSLKVCEIQLDGKEPRIVISGAYTSGADFDVEVDVFFPFEPFRLDIARFINAVRTFPESEIFVEVSEANSAAVIYEANANPKHICAIAMLATLKNINEHRNS